MEELRQRLLVSQGGKCFIRENPVDLQLQECEIDHIIPRAKGGKDQDTNKALVHKSCNRSKLDSDLPVARCMARYESIKERYPSEGTNRPDLGDLLREFDGAKFDLHIRTKLNDGIVEYSLSELDNRIYAIPIYYDKLSGLNYFFAELPRIHTSRRSH